MILFVFEGEEREPELYKTLERLYFPRENDNIVCSFGNNIYALYMEMLALDGDGDIVSVMKEKLSERGDKALEGKRSSDFSEIYLFFDYDFQNSQLSIEEINRRVGEMLEMFDEETDSGKLYINYPMIESIRYVKELPDERYIEYCVTREDCHDFKRLASEFSYYGSLDFLLFKEGEKPSHEKYMKISDNWKIQKNMNVQKANWLVTGIASMPTEKSVINQMAIFKAQREKFVEANDSVSILNSFPIFVFEYLR